MLDIKFIRENKDFIAKAAKKKHLTFNVDDLIEVDEKRRYLVGRIEKKRAEQNASNEKVTHAPSEEERERVIDHLKDVKKELESDMASLHEVMKLWQFLMLAVPNIPDISVPEGKGDENNQELRAWGKKPIYDYAVKSHIDLMQMNNLADFERGVKVSGFRGYFLNNEAALMSFGLWDLAMKLLVRKGYTPMIAPSLVKKEMLLGSGYLPHGEEDLYHNQDNEYYAGTAEVATMGLYSEETIPKEKLPIKIAAFSPCFRREAGSHGKDTKGLIRVHEFFKVEQLILAEANHEMSVNFHEELTANAEELMQMLGLPHRVIVQCGGEMGLPHVKTHDIETWMPFEARYRETHSCSYYHDFQARRLGIRYTDDDGKKKYVYSLNATMIATPRTIAALIENGQKADGSIRVPEALAPYVGKRLIGERD